jgi:2-hydroxyacyl-CoA lyase 1
MLVLASRRGYPGEGGAFQNASFVETMSPITKWSAEVPTADDILLMMAEARRVALDGQPGPVYLEFPETVLTEKGSSGPGAGKPEDTADLVEAEAASLDVPVELIGSATRPLLCLSENLRWGWDAAALRSLVERHELPFMTTPMGRGLLPDAHPLCFNRWRRRALQKTDLFILVGGALDWRFRHGRDLAAGCKVVQVGLDADLLGMNVANAWQARMAPARFVNGLGKALPESLNGLSGWHDLLAELGSQSARPFARDYVSPSGFVDPEVFLRGLQCRLPKEAIVVIDGSICLSLSNHLLRAGRPFSWFDPGLNGCIGAGIPQAIGAKLAAPDRPVVAIVGDTGFGMSGTELETAARYGIAVKVIVFNNSGITGAHRDRRIFGNAAARSVAGYQRGLRYDRMAEGLGVRSACSDDADTALEQFDSMITADGPACLNLQIDPDFPVPDIW